MSALAILLTSTSSELEKHVQRCKARLQISQCYDKFTKLLEAGNLNGGNPDYNGLAEIALESVVSV
jgi:hypothetical protein